MKIISNPKVSIIILNWNGLDDTIECLESVKKIDYPNYEIVVVDNGSKDGSPNKIKELFPKATVIENKKNVGFGEGNNIGIRHALENKADYIFLLNNDTVIDPEILNRFMEAVKKYPEAGIYGAKIYYHSEPNKIWYAGAKWDKYAQNFYHLGLGEHDDNGNFDQMVETDYVCGCALFFKRDVAETIGLFDRRFFAYYEDGDWCFRARRCGYKCIFVPKAKVWHKVSTSLGHLSESHVYLCTRNRLLWARKNLPFKERAPMCIYLIISEFMPSIFETRQFPLIKRIYWDGIRIRRQCKNPQFRAKIAGVKDFILGRFSETAYCGKN